MISHEHQCIFIHIPKTAGTSIEKKLGLFKELERGVQDHRTVRELTLPTLPKLWRMYQREKEMDVFIRPLKNMVRRYETLTPQQFNSYYKFAFVRNSWARAFSWYKNVMRFEPHRQKDNIPDDCTFEQFLTEHPTQWALRSQLYWLQDCNGDIGVDFVGRFEQLDQDFQTICHRLGIGDVDLPKMLASDHRKYVDHYNDTTRQIVADRYADEITLFGFEFGA